MWPGATSPLGSLALDNPAIFCIPIGFLGCFLGTKLSSERGNERQYDELYVRSETGLGAEAAGDGHAPKPKKQRTEPAPEPVGTRVSADVVELTRELVEIRTVNPPGDEEKAASLLAARLEAAGFSVASYEFAPGPDVARRPPPG